jgi:signal transduction histidine kinase
MPRRLTSRDLLPAILLGAATVAEALLNPQVSDGTFVPAAFAAGMSAPLATRRITPLGSLLSTWLVFDVQELLLGTLSEGALPFVVLLVAMYAAAARLMGGRLVAAVVASFVGVGISVALDAGGPDLDGAIYGALVVTAAMGSGHLFGGRQREVDALASEHERMLGEREEAAREAAARERTRIAHELHDIITHRVSAMVLQASSERRVIELGSGDAASSAEATVETLHSIEQLGRDAMVELRHLLGALHHGDDAPRAPQPDLTRIAALVDETGRAGQPVELETVGTPRDVPAGVGLSAYRVVQEALSNALRHAPGAATSVTVEYGDEWIEVRVANEPVAGAPDPAPRIEGLGMGLAGMRERVALFGGRLTAGQTSSDGFAVIARMPLHEVAT